MAKIGNEAMLIFRLALANANERVSSCKPGKRAAQTTVDHHRGLESGVRVLTQEILLVIKTLESR